MCKSIDIIITWTDFALNRQWLNCSRYLQYRYYINCGTILFYRVKRVSSNGSIVLPPEDTEVILNSAYWKLHLTTHELHSRRNLVCWLETIRLNHKKSSGILKFMCVCNSQSSEFVIHILSQKSECKFLPLLRNLLALGICGECIMWTPTFTRSQSTAAWILNIHKAVIELHLANFEEKTLNIP